MPVSLSKAIRFQVAPRDVPPEKAARRLHLTLAEFDRLKDELFARGFPSPDPTTGNYDLRAIDLWMDSRSNIGPTIDLTEGVQRRNAADVFKDRTARLSNGQ